MFLPCCLLAGCTHRLRRRLRRKLRRRALLKLPRQDLMAALRLLAMLLLKQPRSSSRPTPTWKTARVQQQLRAQLPFRPALLQAPSKHGQPCALCLQRQARCRRGQGGQLLPLSPRFTARQSLSSLKWQALQSSKWCTSSRQHASWTLLLRVLPATALLALSRLRHQRTSRQAAAMRQSSHSSCGS